MTKRVLVISANPKKDSFSEQLSMAYAESARHRAEVRVVKLCNMSFNPDLDHGYATEQTLEPDLLEFQRSLVWAEHVLICTPIWWGSVPAKFKGLLDRTLLPGFAFKYEQGKMRPKQLLKHKTARIIMTMDTPPWYYKYIQGAPALKELKLATLMFCGFTNVKHNFLGPVIGSSDVARQAWIVKAAALGNKVE